MKRVVVTGLGLLTPVGNDVDSTWDSLLAGRSGLGTITRFDASGYEYPIAGELDGFEPKDHVDAKLLRRIDASTVYAIATSRQAVADAGLDLSLEDPRDVGVVLGTGIGGAHLMVEQQEILDRKGPRRVSPFLISNFLPDTATGLVAIALGAQGPNMAITAACATGGAAIGEAAEMVRRGDAEVMVAGGFEAPLRPVYYASFQAMRALGTHEDPALASRPFDLERNGFVLAEGAGSMVIESLEHAEARGARIYAEWKGAGTANDAFDMASPPDDGSGIRYAMEAALRSACLEPAAIDYINAHGTGTEINDRVETGAIRTVFGEQADELMVSSTKSMIGHMMGAAGAVEAVIAVLACHHGAVPPTINYETPDPVCDLDYVPNVARHVPVGHAMSTSVGLGGHNSAVIFGAWENGA
jgi:beta-ketoacyl-acyl-carrier-protein synthase II